MHALVHVLSTVAFTCFRSFLICGVLSSNYASMSYKYFTVRPWDKSKNQPPNVGSTQAPPWWQCSSPDRWPCEELCRCCLGGAFVDLPWIVGSYYNICSIFSISSTVEWHMLLINGLITVECLRNPPSIIHDCTWGCVSGWLGEWVGGWVSEWVAAWGNEYVMGWLWVGLDGWVSWWVSEGVGGICLFG